MANFHKFLSTVETITKKNLENFIDHAKYDLTLWSDPQFQMGLTSLAYASPPSKIFKIRRFLQKR